MSAMMNRRRFLDTLGASLLAAPLDVSAQQTGRKVAIGILNTATKEAAGPLLGHLYEGLRDRGYVEGRNAMIEPRYADGRPERLPQLAAELVQARVDVIVAPINSDILAAKKATTTIPIVMVHAIDPIEAGFVKSLARPGGNITGFTLGAGPETAGKRLQLLREIVPKLSRIAILWQGGGGTSANVAETRAAATRLGLALDVVEFRAVEDIEASFATMRRKSVEAVVIIGGPLTWMRRHQIAELATKHRLPSAHGLREYAQAGVLITYGASITDLYRRAAGHVDRILRGDHPADLPVEQPTKFELVINLRTAKALGLTVPPSLLLRADQVIE